MSVFTRIVPAAYRLLGLDALARTRAGERLFLASFFAYKKWIEDPHAAFLARHPEVIAGGHVLDVGANVGYTASVFAAALSPGFRVHAFEPDERNFARLQRVVERNGLADRVVPVFSAAGAENGTAALRPNPKHPGDHRIVSDAQPGDASVPIVRLDTYCEQAAVAPVKFVKIDVQGHELAVARGMAELVERFPDLEVSFEYSGPQSDSVVEWYRDRGFAHFVMLHDGAIVPAVADATAAEVRRRGYADLFATRDTMKRG